MKAPLYVVAGLKADVLKSFIAGYLEYHVQLEYRTIRVSHISNFAQLEYRTK